MSSKKKARIVHVQAPAITDAPIIETASPADAPFGAALKYTGKQEVILANNLAGTPNWALRDTLFTVGPYTKMKDSSVFGKIRAAVALKGPISGRDLVSYLQQNVIFQGLHPNSPYVRNGKPVAPWLEDYIRGAAAESKQVLNIVKK